jgi:hypothetical protein
MSKQVNNANKLKNRTLLDFGWKSNAEKARIVGMKEMKK